MKKIRDNAILRNSFSALLIIITLIWISFLIYNEKDKVCLQFSEIKWSGFYYMIFFGSLATFTNAAIFNTILKVNLKKNINFFYSSSLLFVGQMIRHLPGRFWGVVYQINAVREKISALEMIKINYDFMIISAGLTIVIPTSVIFYSFKPILGISFFFISIVLLTYSLKKNIHIIIIQKSINILPFTNIKLIDKIQPINSYSFLEIISALCWGGLGWIFYFIGWKFLGFTFESFSYINLYLLCAIYSIAWLIGFLSIITPSGIGVREMAFILLTPEFGNTNMAIIAVIIRLWLLIDDIVLSVIFFLLYYLKIRNKNEEI